MHLWRFFVVIDKRDVVNAAAAAGIGEVLPFPQTKQIVKNPQLLEDNLTETALVPAAVESADHPGGGARDRGVVVVCGPLKDSHTMEHLRPHFSGRPRGDDRSVREWCPSTMHTSLRRSVHKRMLCSVQVILARDTSIPPRT